MMSTKKAMFEFKNEFNSHDESRCMVEIVVDEKRYVSGQTYYDMKFIYTYEGDEATRKLIQPFYMEEDSDGVIVLKNTMTEIMVTYLLMNSEELQKVSGTSTAQHYRLQIMKGLINLWD